MNGPFRVAQANIGSQPAAKPPTRIVKLAKPYSEQSVTVPLSYDGTVKADFSAIANEKITLVHVGEKLIILFDNKSTLTLEPFFDSSGKPLGNVTVEVSPGRDLTGAEFAALFPVTEDQSVLPAAGPGTGNAQSSGANFTSVGVDPFSLPNPLDLLGQEELPNFTIENLLAQVFINDVPTVSANDALAFDEDGLPNGNLAGIADLDPATNGPVTLTGTLAFSYGADQAGSVVLLGAGAPGGFTYTLNGDGTLLTVSQLQDGVSVNVLQITLTDTTSGNYTITQLNPIRHAAGGDENDQQFTFTYRVTDSNGDFVDGTLSLSVDDDTPTIDVNVSEGEGGSAQLFLNPLDESIGNDPNNTGIPGTLDDVGPGPDLTGTTPFGRIQSFVVAGEGQSPGFSQLASLFNIIKNPGADGELITTQAFSLTLTGSEAVATNLTATALAGTPLASLDDSERAVVLVQVNATTVEARVIGDAAVSGDEFVVLRITLLNANDPANVQLRVEQFLPIDHGADSNDFDSSLPLLISDIGASLGLTLTATIIDNDGDPATSSETIVFVGNGPASAINIEDDGPVLNDEGEEEEEEQPSPQSISLKLDETIGEDRYNTAPDPDETESPNGDLPNSTPDDTSATAVAAPSTAPADSAAIGKITTGTGVIASNFPALSADFGTDGPGPNGGFSQELSFVLTGGGATNLRVTKLDNTPLENLTDSQRNIVLTIEGGAIVGRVVGTASASDDYVAFRITIQNADDPATATITVEQFLPIDHGGTENPSVFDEFIPLLLTGEGSSLRLQLVTSVTDGDTDTIVQTDTVNLTGGRTPFIAFDDDGPKVAVTANASFSVEHDETLLVQSPDDILFTSLFNGVNNKGDDQDVPLSLPLGFARSDNAALTIVNVDFGSDGGALSGSQVYSLTLTDLAGFQTTGPILSGLQTTELRDIYLFVEGNFIVGRYDPGVGLPDASDPAAFALAINPTTGIVSVVQYVSLYHPDGTDRDDTVFLDDIAGSLNATLTVTDGDGDTASASVSIGAKVSFDDDGPFVAAIRNGNFRLTVDETPGVDSGTDDVAGPLTIFSGITQQGDDPDISGADPLAFATEASNPLVFVPLFGVDGPAVSNALVYSLDLNEPVAGAGVLTNLLATDGSPIRLFAETDGITDWIVGRVDNPDSALDGDAAFAIHIDPVSGTVSLVQYLSLQHPNDADPNDAVTLAGGLIDAVVTLTDRDGDTASSEVNISNRIVFRDDRPTLVQRAPTTAIVDEDGLHNPGTSTLSDANIDDPEVDGEVAGTNSNVFNGVQGDLSALVNFGADGFGSFGLKTVATPQPAGVKSQDKDVLIVSDGTILRGYVENGVGDPGFDDGDRLVFTLTVNPNGSYTFTLLDQIDHPSLDGEAADDTENLLDVAAIDLSSFISAEDGDGDSVPLGAGSFTVQVLDDIPVLTARPANQTQTTVTETLAFDLKGGNDIVGGVSTNSIKGIWATGVDIIDDDDTANTSNNSIGIGDGQSIDGQETKGKKTTGPEVLTLEFFENVNIPNGNGLPTHGLSYDVNRFRFSIDAAEAQNNDDAVVFVSVLNNGAVVSPANYVITINGGTPAAAGVIVHNVFNGATLVGFVFENVPDDADFQISANTGFVFDAVKVGNYNAFQFTSDGNAPKTVSTGNSFKVYGLEADIDTTIVTLETFKVSHDESPGVNVDPDPNAANDVDPNVTTPPDAIAGATIGYARSPGSVLAPGSLFAGKVGADENGTYSFTITDAQGEPIDDVDSGLKTLNGTPIFLSTDGTGAVVGTAGSTIVFKVYVDADGFVWIAQFAPIAHNLDGSGAAALDDIAQVTAALYITGSLTDFDGDTVTTTSPVALRVEFQDDGPVAVDDTDFVTEDGPASADGNVRTGVGGSDTNDQDGVADALGTDGFGSIVWSGASQAGTIAGTYGTLTVGTDGSYTYTLYTQQQNPTAYAAVQGLTSGETLSEEFGYQIVDGDGDSDLATLTITINGNDDGVTISDIAAVGGDTVVDEKGLPASSGSEGTGEAAVAGPGTDQSETNTGTFSFSTPDGFGALVIEGQTITLAQLQNAAGTPITITGGTTLGLLTIIGFAGTAAGGTVTYRFTLLDNTTAHTDTDNNVSDGDSNRGADDQAFVSYSVQVLDEDASPDSATATLTIAINDDAPIAADEQPQNVGEGVTLPGTFDFVAGADGATVTHINGNALSFNGDGWTDWIDVGGSNQGAIRVKADGSYEFRADNPTLSPVAPVIGTFTVTDGDNDTDTKAFAFQITDVNTPTAGNKAAAVDDDGLTGGNAASTTGDLDANLGDLDTDEKTFTGVLGGSVGLDGAGANGFAFAATLNGATAMVGLEEVTYTVAGGLLTAKITNTTDSSRLNTTLFTVEITDQATGAFKVTLLDNVLHADGPNNEATDATVNLGYVITDADGSSVPGNVLTVTFDDDAPTATAEASQNVAEGTTLTGGQFDFVAGADGATVTHINGNPLSFNGDGWTSWIDLGVGDIRVRADGGYEFRTDAASVNPVTITGTFTVTDGDRDTDTKGFTFIVTDANTPTAGSAVAAVDDDGLIGGNAASTTGDLDAHLGDLDTDEKTFTGVLGGTVGGDGAGTNGFTFSATLNGATAMVGLEEVTYTVAGGLLTAKITNTTDSSRLNTTLFTVEITDQATGAFKVTLLDNVLHAGGPNDEAIDATVNLGYVITDADGSTVPGNVLTVTFDDDAPTATAATAANVNEGLLPTDRNPSGIAQADTGFLNINWGADNGADKHLEFVKDTLGNPVGPSLSSDGVPLLYAIRFPGDSPGNEQIVAYKTGGDPDNDADVVFRVTLYESGNGFYTYVQYQNIDHDDAGTDVNTFGFTITAFDTDGDSVQQTLTINVTDDVPDADDDSVTQAAANENQAVTVNVFANDVAGADGIDLDNNPNVVVTSSNLSGLGSLVYNNNGTFTYTPASGETGNVTFNYTIKDGDGDTSTALVTITLAADSVPQIVTTTNLTVDEDGLSGIANVDASLPTETDSTESATQSGTIVVTYGKDVPANLLAAIQLSNTGLDTQLDALGGDVTWVLSNSNRTLTGSVGATPVMTIAITAANVTNAGTGEVTYDYTATLLQPVTHPGNPNEDFVTLSNIGFTVTDSDNDPQPGSFSVTVYDDVPEAVDNSVTQAAADENQAVTVNVFANDVAGADGVDLDNNPNVVVTSSNLSGLGSLVYNNNGTFTYTPASGETGNVTFNYTIKDGDGDPSTALVTITLAADSAPQIVTTTNLTVDEDGLSAIANVDASLPTETDSTESATQSGTIVVTFGKDVPANLLAAIQLSTLGLNPQLDALGGDVTWVLSNSNRTLTGSVGFTPVMTIAITAANVTNAGTGEVTYDYTATLLQPVTHPGNPNEDFVTLDNVFFSVVDSDNSVQAGSFDVTIYDDVPEAVDNLVTQAAANENQAVTVNVFANDVAGADGIDLDNDPDVFVTGSLVTGLGSLVYNNNGTFTYTPASGETGNVTFNYTIKDGDGDTSTALVTITLAADSVPQIVTTTNLTVDEDGLSGIANVDASLPTETDSTESATQSGTIVVTYGKDVPANLLAAIQLSNTGLDTQLDALGGDVTWVLSNSNRTLTGSVGATPVMTIAITAANVTNAGTGEVTYDYTATLLQPVTHPGNPNEDFVTLSNIGFTVTDSDNDPQPGSFSVTVYDDVPEAVADADTLDATAFTSASGNVVSGTGTTGGAASADTIGADGGGIVSGIISDFTGGSTTVVPPGVSGATIAGHYGNLTIHQDGSYTYSVTSTAVPASASDVFTYTLKDADGDTSTAKLTINFPAVDAPTITLGTGDATLEDTAVTAQFTATPDTSPASTITQIVISGLTGWTQGTITLSNGTVGSSTFAAGVLTINVSGATAGTAVVASVVLTPPANSDIDASLSMTATSKTGVVVATSAAATDTLYVDAVADPVTVVVGVSDSTSDGDTSFSANETGTLNAVATFGDNGDGSETHTVTIQLQSGFTAKVDGGTTLPSSGTSWVYLGVTYNYAFTYVAASGLLTVTVPNSAASATINIGVQAPGTLPATLTFDATATATETIISGGGTGAGNVDLAGNNTATATDTTGIPVTRQLNATIRTNTNSADQDMILTFVDKESPLDAYAQVILRAGTGSENAFVADAGFNIDNGSFLVALENGIPGSKIIVREFVLEGVTIGSGNEQIDYDGSSGKDAAITATITPPTTPVAATPSTDGGSGNNTGGSAVTDPNVNVFNYLAGQEGNDTVTATTGSDILSGGLGTDNVDAGTGNDIIVYSAGDTMNGGGGFDILRVDQGALYNTATFQGGSLGTPALSISSAEVTLSGTLSNIDSILLTQESTPDATKGTELNLSITDVLNMTDADNELSIDYSTDAFTGTDKTLFVIGSQGDKLDIDTAAWTLQAGTYSSPGGQIFNQYAALSGGNVLHLYVDQNIQVI